MDKLNASLIARTVSITRQRLGLTKTEMAADLPAILAALDDPQDRDQIRDALTAYEAQEIEKGFRPMDGPTFKDARKELGLTGAQMAHFLGIAPASARSSISSLEKGRHPVQVHHVRLMRAYLSGHRPPDWPKKW